MTYETKMKNTYKNKFKSMVKHPYFGFFVITIIMLLVQVLRVAGVDVANQTLRAFGKTMIYIIVGLGFSILLGFSGLASLGTAGFVGLGADLNPGLHHQQMTFDLKALVYGVQILTTIVTKRLS